MSLSGYGENVSGQEAVPTNQLLAFSGMSYAGVAGAGDHYTGKSPDMCDYCIGGAHTQAGFTTHPIGLNVTAVGAFYGRSINPGAGEVIAEDGGKVVAAAVSVGEGRVFMFHDEWVTYNSQWNGLDLAEDCRMYEANHSCANRHPATDFQIPQFWFNSIKWLSGDIACFDIMDPTIIK